MKNLNKIAAIIALSIYTQVFATPITEDNIVEYSAKAKQYQTDYVFPEAIAQALKEYFGQTFYVITNRETGEITYAVIQGTYGTNLTYYREFKAQSNVAVDTSYISVWNYPAVKQ